jgi:hypothetical protein
MKQLPNSMQSNKVYLDTFDMCFISYSTNVNAILKLRSNCDSSTLAMACEVRSRSLEGTVTHEVGISVLLHIFIGVSRMEQCPWI